MDFTEFRETIDIDAAGKRGLTGRGNARYVYKTTGANIKPAGGCPDGAPTFTGPPTNDIVLPNGTCSRFVNDKPTKHPSLNVDRCRVGREKAERGWRGYLSNARRPRVRHKIGYRRQAECNPLWSRETIHRR